ncbi:hypothetical protein MFLO_08387 [Listeria floridensis FSL S10-1187]|uniref:DUF1033 family protein n=1 Tax=Listeria floridensis FSL S10-1187 TaxID=1265817 RepID=A0ABP3AY07_9LIST|nr:DUF1033 family protein [Listeria floridensis]EUJ31813.1 hypothetical protein MFLO_08387 [Listeria floridensis FSL S10-1187]
MTEWSVLTTTGEYEPWWFFEDWEETISEQFRFTNRDEAFQTYQKIAADLIKNYPHHALKKQVLFAAWNEDEILYCEDCEDDIQTFHGLILLKDGAVYQPNEAEKAAWFREVAPFQTDLAN